MEQPQYNLLHRKRLEIEYEPIFREFGMGTTIWSPLAYGILTGKYNDGIPDGSRLAANDWLTDRLTDSNIERIRQFSDYAKELGATPAQLAIAWCLKNPRVSTVILGATNTSQLEENLEALPLSQQFGNDFLDRLNDLFPAEGG